MHNQLRNAATMVLGTNSGLILIAARERLDFYRDLLEK
jgi:hypothetical protein